MNYNPCKKGEIHIILLCLMVFCFSCTSISEKEQQEDEQMLWAQSGKENSTLYVDTTLQYRNILIEELTGRKCYS